MSKFKNCPQLWYLKSINKTCDDYEHDNCDGCNIYTAYYIGRADALKDALELQRKLDRGN